MDVVYSDDVMPVFPDDVIRLEFPEDTPVSTVLYIATAVVGRDVTVVYSLSDNDCVSIDRWTGEMRLRRELDREMTSVHWMTVTATTHSGNSADVNVTLTVLDCNDNDPVFSQPVYYWHITSTDSTFVVDAKDSDENENGRIVYFLLNDDDVFHISPHTALIYTNHSTPANTTLTVVAMDAGTLPRKSSALVMVTSDVSTAVKCAVDSLTVQENQPSYSIVGTVSLVYDDGANVIVTEYQLIEDGGQQMFGIGVKTGDIVTKSILDRETASNHILTISAVYSLPGL